MRGGAGLCLTLAVGLASPGVAQEPAALPAGSATIRGRVVHAERSEAAAGVEVVVYALPPDAPPGIGRTVSDPEGGFVFEGLSNDPRTPYLLGARFAGVAHPGERIVFEPGETEREVEIRIADVTDDASSVHVRGVTVRIDRLGGQLVVNESVQFDHTAPRTYYVPEAQRNPERAGFSSTLPDGASAFTMPFGIVPEGLVRSGDELTFYGPLYPGQQELSYRYSIPASADAAEMGRVFGRGVETVAFLVPRESSEVEAPGFPDGEDVTLDGRLYRRFARSSLPAGEAVRFGLRLSDVTIEPGEVAVAETRLFVHLDEAAVLVREEYHLEVAGSASVVGTPESPLLSVRLPEDAHSLRFQPDFGLSSGEEGDIDVLGPVPAGESVLEILYRLPSNGGPLSLEKQFVASTPLLTVLVTDTGLVVEAARLHRRRPVRGKDRTFMHLEAFEIEAGERVSMTFSPLPLRRSPGQVLHAVLVLGATLAAVLFLVSPLRARRIEPSEEAIEVSPARHERESVIAAIRDLDHDYETGKVSEADYGSFRDELRARALALMQEERDASPPAAAPATSTQAFCTACGAARGEADRFCAQCGARLLGEAAAEERGAKA